MDIRHLGGERPYQWLIGSNVTCIFNLLHINDNCIQVLVHNGLQYHLSIIDGRTHNFVWRGRFVDAFSDPIGPTKSVTVLAGHALETTDQPKHTFCPLIDISPIIKRVYQHVCGHATYGDMQSVLQRNKL